MGRREMGGGRKVFSEASSLVLTYSADVLSNSRPFSQISVPQYLRFSPSMRWKLPTRMTAACLADEMTFSEALLDAVLLIEAQSDFRVL